MPFALIVGLVLLGQNKSDPDQFPLALHRSMEIDDLDRELVRLHDSVLVKRSQLASSQRLAQRKLISRNDIERETAELRSQEAHEAEAVAYRAFKVYERDLQGKVVEPDERKAYNLLLDLIRKQLAIAQVEVDYRTFLLKQTRTLHARKAVSRQELEDAENAHGEAEANVNLSRSREAQVVLELTARNGEKAVDPAEYHRLKTEYLKARVLYYERNAEGAKRRLEIARDRARLGLIPANEIEMFARAAADSAKALDKERQALERHEKEGPAEPPKRPESRASLRPRAS